MSKKILRKEELSALIRALRDQMESLHSCLEDSGESWKQACQYLRQLRMDKDLILKLSQLWEMTEKQVTVTTDSNQSTVRPNTKRGSKVP